jgi:hypothetical protein
MRPRRFIPALSRRAAARYVAIGVAAIAIGYGGTAVATSWTVALNTGSSAQGQSPATPPPPTPAPVATCGAGATVKVTWTAVTGAKTYTAYRGPSAAGPWTSIGTATAPTVTVTSGTLTAGTYYFAVTMTTNDAAWPASAQSAASGTRTITGSTCA